MYIDFFCISGLPCNDVEVAQIWVGYVRGTNSIRKHLLTITPNGLPRWDWLSVLPLFPVCALPL